MAIATPKQTTMIDYGLIKNFLAIDIIIAPIDGATYWMDLTPNLSMAIPVEGGYKFVKENLKPDYAITSAWELRKQGFDVLLFPAK